MVGPGRSYRPGPRQAPYPNPAFLDRLGSPAHNRVMPTFARVARRIEQLLDADPSHAHRIRAMLPEPAPVPVEALIRTLLDADPANADVIRAMLPEQPPVVVAEPEAPAAVEPEPAAEAAPAPRKRAAKKAATTGDAPERLDVSTLGQEPGTVMVDGAPPTVPQA